LFLFGAVRGWYRTRTIQHIRPEHRDEIQTFWWGYVLLFPLASTLTAYNLARSALTSSIEWRDRARPALPPRARASPSRRSWCARSRRLRRRRFGFLCAGST
jgi:hypothetical protein